VRSIPVIIGVLALVALVWQASPLAQGGNGEDVRALSGEGTHIGDYTGIPLNAAGLLRSQTWDSSVWSEKERQAEPHQAQYYWQGGALTNILDANGRIIAYTCCALFGGALRTIWMDGRPHPPEWAEHTWAGFNTGQWVGNVLTVTTTHMKTGMVNRNGTVSSQKAVVTAHFIYRENGTVLTVLQFVDDPAYYSEPLVRSRDNTLPFNPAAQLGGGGAAAGPGAGGGNILEIIDEVKWPKGYVPSYALGSKHTDWAESVGLPYEVSLGGAEQMYPEYLPKLRKLVADYQAQMKKQAAAPKSTTAK
jgi:hypothetical protein